jgi:hypothetical protein
MKILYETMKIVELVLKYVGHIVGAEDGAGTGAEIFTRWSQS